MICGIVDAVDWASFTTGFSSNKLFPRMVSQFKWGVTATIIVNSLLNSHFGDHSCRSWDRERCRIIIDVQPTVRFLTRCSSCWSCQSRRYAHKDGHETGETRPLNARKTVALFADVVALPFSWSIRNISTLSIYFPFLVFVTNQIRVQKISWKLEHWLTFIDDFSPYTLLLPPGRDIKWSTCKSTRKTAITVITELTAHTIRLTAHTIDS